MKLKVIQSQSCWKEIVEGFTLIDAYYDFKYGKMFAKEEKGELFAAYMEKGNAKLFYPFIKRKVQWNEGGLLYDIVTPYGYGGPYIEGKSNKIIDDFYEQFSEYCSSNHIVTETIRFHPLTKSYNLLKNIMDVSYIRKTTAVDLTKCLTEIKSNYSSMNKRNINKAKKEGLSCFLAPPTLENIRLFMELYKETMNRNNASDYYYFKEDYFYEQMKETNLSKTYLLFTEYENKVIAGVMVIIGREFAHYHLGASSTSFLHKRPNNLLFDYMIEFCKEKGSSLLHLGGGYEEGDGLFKFKSSFTNDNNYDYFIGKKVHNQKAYKKLTEEAKQSYKVNERFFPIYRGILEPRVLKQELLKNK